MARTINEIFDAMVADVQGNPALSELDNTSTTARWRLWLYIEAAAIWALEVIFDAFKSDITGQVLALKPHTLRWYRQAALDFQYGSALPEGETTYDNSGLTDDEVAAQKIIAKAAAIEEDGKVVVKTARSVNGILQQLTSVQYDAASSYLNEIKDAGVSLTLRNDQPDKIRLSLTIYYDPTVLNDSGDRLDGSATDVITAAVDSFLLDLPFNGILVRAHLVDALQAVEGVYVPVVNTLQCGRFDAPDLPEVDVQYNPNAGYLDFDNPNDLTINYISQEDL